MADKQFCGNGKPFGKWGGFKLGLKASDLPKPNDKGWINLVMSPTKGDPNKYYIAVDDYTPPQSREDAPGAPQEDDLPF